MNVKGALQIATSHIANNRHALEPVAGAIKHQHVDRLCRANPFRNRYSREVSKIYLPWRASMLAHRPLAKSRTTSRRARPFNGKKANETNGTDTHAINTQFERTYPGGHSVLEKCTSVLLTMSAIKFYVKNSENARSLTNACIHVAMIVPCVDCLLFAWPVRLVVKA